MAFFIVLEAVLARKYWWLPERYVTCAVKDLPKAIQQFLLEMYIVHSGWGIYYFKDAECVMVEVDNHRLNDVLGREEEEGGGGREVTDLGKFGSVTFFHIALQALGMCTGNMRATPVSADVLMKNQWPCTWESSKGTTGMETGGKEGHWLPTWATLGVPHQISGRKWQGSCLADWKRPRCMVGWRGGII